MRARSRSSWASLLPLLLLVTGCTTALVGAGAAVVLGTAAVLAHQCYDHVYVTVLGPAGKTCDATVVATRGNDEVRLTSCFYAALTEGTWTVRARAPGLGSTSTTVIVAPPDHCTAHVQSVEMTLAGPGQLFTSPLPAPAPTMLAPAPPMPAPVATSPVAAPPTDAGASDAEPGDAAADGSAGRLPDER